MDEEIKCEVAGQIVGQGYNDMIGRVYSAEGCSPAIRTCIGGNNEPKIIVPEATKKGYDEATYGDSINMAYPGSPTRRGRVGHGVAQTLTAGDVQQVIVEPIAYDEQNDYLRTDGTVGTLTTDGSSPKHNNRIVEPRIAAMRGRNPDNPSDRTAGSPTEQRLEIGSEETSNTLTTVQKDNLVIEPAVLTPKRTEYGKAIRKDYEAGKIQESRHNMTELEPRTDGITNTLTTVQKDNLVVEPQYRIRKLTERECFRLMGVKEQDFEKVAENQSTSSLYHLAGDSIVTTCLMALLGWLFGADYQEKINELVEELIK